MGTCSKPELGDKTPKEIIYSSKKIQLVRYEFEKRKQFDLKIGPLLITFDNLDILFDHIALFYVNNYTCGLVRKKDIPNELFEELKKIGEALDRIIEEADVDDWVRGREHREDHEDSR
ncbi:hypothetical protein AKJ65_03140 [candidate division MSBL1 archaeon SCGC-AAA259E19]|uniref:Uncharacterized protein n=1 Tax=candidate division MSBL1 archaeon SCGC-AAA259E19 TaxID=1698264 RepID=A0A133UL29_9EURY|nr:hypothetical protein AKJ65_03140 [candidate division MSBL1 archaeon SCGC-AAA259E19]